VFHVIPIVSNWERLKAGLPHFGFDTTKEIYLGVLPRKGEPFLIISNELYIHTARRASVLPDVTGSFTPGRLIGERLNDLGLGKGRIGLAGVRNVGRASMPYEHQKDLAAAMPEATFDDAMEVMQAARLIKSAEEIAWFEKGADFTDRSVAAIE